ncbi:MAG: response regulator [Chloroflexota bacterium]|nr:MAG: response regulator [Chloroflexota bacterium]
MGRGRRPTSSWPSSGWPRRRLATPSSTASRRSSSATTRPRPAPRSRSTTPDRASSPTPRSGPRRPAASGCSTCSSGPRASGRSSTSAAGPAAGPTSPWNGDRIDRWAGPLIRVAIVDDHPIVRDGTAAILGAQPGLEVVGTASSVDEAVELIRREPIDVVLLDIRLGTDSGLRLLREDLGGSAAAGATAGATTAATPTPAVVVLSAYDYPQYAEAAIRLGAAGYVIKTAPLPELLAAIERAAAGGMAFSVRPRAGTSAHLTARELEVVRLVIDGRSNDEIGASLQIGAKTVETHLRRLFERFDVASRTELAARALREGWLDIPPD